MAKPGKSYLFLICSAALLILQTPWLLAQPANVWKAEGVPVQAHITGGPWTLQQTGSSNAAPSAGYCVSGVPQPNPGTERMAPYYFPFVTGSGQHLHGIFDYRPRSNNEAVVAASSSDGGFTWQFDQEVLELHRGICPASDAVTLGVDAGLGHSYVLNVNGQTFLYNLDRSPANLDVAGFAVHVLTPLPGAPLNPAPADLDVPQRTTGLLNPDGILGEVPGVSPKTILYIQKRLGADNTDGTALPAAQQCGKPVIFKEPAANHDIALVRLASTVDGINFTDLGAVSGLNDITGVAPTDIRYIGARGTVLLLPGHRWGLLFSGGNCLDGDSDGFHFIGYAESDDLHNWTVINGIQNPIASIAPLTVIFNGSPVTVPATQPLVGNTLGWFEGRVYGPSFTQDGEHGGILTFAGYHTPRPQDDFSDYRNIGRVSLHSSRPILAVSNGTRRDDDDDDDRDHDR